MINDAGKDRGSNRTLGPSTFTIVGIGYSIMLNKIDDQNPIRSSLLKQNDSSFSSRPELQKAGCNFRTAQAYAELTLGVTLSADQIISLWDAAIADGSISSIGVVNDPDKVANAAAKALGFGDLKFTFGWKSTSDANEIGSKRQETWGTGSHFSVGDLKNNEQWDPYNPLLDGKDPTGVKVYAYVEN